MYGANEKAAAKIADEDLRAAYKATQEEMLIRAAREDVVAFNFYCFGWDPVPLHMSWQDHIEKYRRALILSPRYHGKTSQISVSRSIWELGRNHDHLIKIVTQSDSRAKDILSSIIDNIENNEKIKKVFPDLIPAKKGDWSKHKIRVQRTIRSPDASIEALGVLSTGTGGRATILIFDDCVDQRNAILQPKLREAVKNAFKGVWINLLGPGGRVIYICTPWHQDDLTHELMKNPAYKMLRDPIDDKLTPVWPEQWSTKSLEERQLEIGSREFNRGFKLVAIAEEEILFKKHFFEKCYVPEGSTPSLDKLFLYMGVDLAIGQKSISSETALFMIGVEREGDYKGRRWPLDQDVGNFTSPETASKIKGYHDKLGFDSILVENHGYQEALRQWIQDKYGQYIELPITSFTTGGNKADATLGLPGLATEFETGKWAIPVGSGHDLSCNCDLCIWMNQLGSYPVSSGFDRGMASWFAREAVRAISSQGEYERW